MSSAKIIKNTIYYGVVPKLSLLLSVIMLPIITPYLTTYDYGISGVISSYSNFLISIAPLGLNVHLTNSYFEYPRHYNLVWGRVLLLFLVSGAVFGLVNMVALMFVLPMDMSFKLFLLCLIGSLQIFLFGNNILAQHLFPLRESPKPLVFTNLFGSVAGLVTSFVLIYFFRLGYWGLVASGAVSMFLTFVVFMKFVWVDYDIRPIMEHNLRRLRELFRIALPLVPHTLGFVLLTSSARFVMSQYHISYDEIGLYSHGCSMGDYAIIITTALVTAISPQIQRAYRGHDFRRYRMLYILCQSVALTSTFLICIWMPEIYSLLIRNASLAKSSEIATIICFANVVFSFYTFMSTTAFIEKCTKQLLWLVFFPGLLNLVLCYVCIPVFGYRAAIYSTIIAYWSQLAIPFFVKYYRRSVGEWLGGVHRILILFVVILASVLIAQCFVHVDYIYKVVVSVALISAFLYFYKKKQIKDII